MSESGGRKILFWLLIAHLLLTGALALGNPHVHLLDDAYYTLTIARHIADGEGITYGGYATNGFQPLYGFLMTPVMALFGAHPDLCLRLALLLMACASAGLLALVYFLTARLVDERAAVVAGCLYVFNANLIVHSLSGLETPLHALLFWGSIAFYLRLRDDETPRRLLVLGVLLALTAYARFDAVFLFFAVALDWLWRRRHEPWRMIRGGLTIFLPALALLTPWFVWSKAATGSFFQSSGAFHHWRGLVRQDIPESLGGMIKFAVVKLVSLGIKLPLEPLTGYEGLMRLLARRLLGVERLQTGFLAQLLQTRPVAAVVLLLIVAGFAVALLAGGRDGLRRVASLRPLGLVLIALAGAALFYPLYMLNYSMRHFFPFGIGLLMVWGAFFSGLAETKWLRTPMRQTIALLLVALLLALPGLGPWLKSAEPTHARELVRTIERTVPRGARIGYTDCGVYGYYLPEYTVVNLDGILNFTALRAMRSGDIGAYLAEHEVTYVLYLHNFQAEYQRQWDEYVAPRVAVVPPTDWIFRLEQP
ncbi:MAG TPA: glycosyltransferase family 39 protein [bacterium]|nr:glycosyltransferase family 39 protein [bacterium]